MLFKFAVQNFIEDRNLNNLSPHTISSYSRTLSQFHDFLMENGVVNVEDVSPLHIKQFLIHLKEKHQNNPQSLNHKLRNLRTFFNYMEEIRIITHEKNPTRQAKYIKETSKIEVFTDDHIRQMLGYLRRIKQRDKVFVSYRNYTIIVFLLGTGVRVGELVNLMWNDVDLVNGVVTVIGKKRVSSSIPLTEKLKKELAEYRTFQQHSFKRTIEYVFPSADGTKWTTNGAKMMFKHLAKIMNFRDVRLSAHTFRHTFAHRCLMSGMDVFTLQKMLRHSKLDMTMRYVAMWGTALKEQNEKFNPLNNLDI